MTNVWTKEQLDAIHLEGNNIIVSAGAGSGKTAVLSERVLRKIDDGISINQILILTFTNAAAKEMKDRIRDKLRKANKQEQIDLIDHSYITTFDSFSLSIVKKYHTILNISKDIGITDSSLLDIKKQELMDEIFNCYYSEKNKKFKKLITNFCLKEDDSLKKLLIRLNDKLDMRYNKLDYLNQYIKTYYQEDFIEEGIALYYDKINDLILKIKEIVRRLNHYMDFDYIIKLEDKLSKLWKAKDYNDVVLALDFRLPNLPKNQDSFVKCLKEELSSYIKEIKSLCIYKNTDQIKEEYFATKDNLEIIVEIIKELDQRLKEEKVKSNMYDFSDISRMAIEVVTQNEEIKEELKNSFQEIMIDEYQDTNDIQEYFISLISNHNVYMVGDIKQSIYRFRNANPYIFKNKYDNYIQAKEGLKIDLLKNFRSRKEVLEDINIVFNDLMSDDMGGADYKNSHQMIFGNKTYQEEGKTNQNYHLSILTYLEGPNFSNSEKEIFIIAEDIKEKIDSNYQIFDKDRKILRKMEYSDCVILMDRSTDFDRYKKIFEFLKIPLTLYQDEELKSGYDILVIRNLLKLIKCMDCEQYQEEFKYAFLSVGRSFLFRIEDDKLFEYLTQNTYKESEIYKKLEEAYQYFYEMSLKMFFMKLCEIFEYEEKLLEIGNVMVARVRLEYFYHLLDEFSKNGKDLADFIIYLDTIFEKEHKVNFSLNTTDANSVKIMTIHKSKGLEFPICYFSGFTKEFSFREFNDLILYSNQYGIIIPYFNEYIKPTIYKNLLKIDMKKEEISEKIRLFYVALTRAKEKMIIVIPEREGEILGLEKIKSFYDMMQLMYSNICQYYIRKDPSCTKDYMTSLYKKDEFDLNCGDETEMEEPSFLFQEERKEKLSKNTTQLLTKEDSVKMRYGSYIHKILEFLDFNNPNYQGIEDNIVPKIKSFVSSSLIQSNLDAKFYHEYEFTYNKEEKRVHGIIDLIIENKDEIIIVDYKLKKIEDAAYQEQLRGYQKIIENRTNKRVTTYLYSILDEKWYPIEQC
ncbi:MAG: UvrD-helicase domain-containing protein [Bacilli bacterium]|nr:UvrD-helicase domain-containing protein [Bacilli bacterium]